MGKIIGDLKRRCCSDSKEFEYWDSLHNDIQEFMSTATVEDREEWLSDWVVGETAIMMYEYLKAARKQEKK